MSCFTSVREALSLNSVSPPCITPDQTKYLSFLEGLTQVRARYIPRSFDLNSEVVKADDAD